MARYFAHNIARYHVVGAGLGSAVLISAELVVVITLISRRLVRGYISEFGKAVVVAALTSICTYAVNDIVLKFLFGMPSPADFLLQGADHAFHFGRGAQYASFPSGHMALAASFGVVMMRLRPATVRVLGPLLVVGAVALVVGDWHFVSDVVAGGFVGFLGGRLATALWTAHIQRILLERKPR